MGGSGGEEGEAADQEQESGKHAGTLARRRMGEIPDPPRYLLGELSFGGAASILPRCLRAA